MKSVSAQSDDDEDEYVDDYFYESGLDENQVQEMHNKRIEEEALKKSLETTTLKTTPAFFAAKESKDQDIDWNKYYMETMVKAYMKKYQDEQLEKRRLKFESDVNHPMLSIITLTTFFGVSTMIGLIIVYVRGRQFRKNDSVKLEKKAYNSVSQIENNVV